MVSGCDVDVAAAVVAAAVAVGVAAVAVVAAAVAVGLGGSNPHRVGSEDPAVAVAESNQHCTLVPSTSTTLEP